MATIYFCESSRLFKGRFAILARRIIQAFGADFFPNALPEQQMLNGSNSETKRLHRVLLVAIERADFLEPLMQRRDEV